MCGVIAVRTVLWANGLMMARLGAGNVAAVLLVTCGLGAVWAQVNVMHVPVGSTGRSCDLSALSARPVVFNPTKAEWCA